MFVSLFFLLFLGMVIFIYFLMPARWRPVVLLLSSWFFCGYLDLQALLVLIIVSVCVFWAGIKIEDLQKDGNSTQSRKLTIAAICVCVLMLFIYKYIGLSFYLFQAIGYLVDVHQGKSKAERNFWYLGCYFAFFAKLVSGPIEREGNFLLQIRETDKVKFWDKGRLSGAFTYMLWGYFMKMVVADRLAMPIRILFENPQNFDSFWLLLGTFLYTIQIYCDFAGYSYIAIGCARIFGISLTQNFRAPYFAGSITDFWRRWHVSLSSWLKDYIYIPLGGSRKGDVRKCLNTMIVFLVCGAWHGAGLNFIVWGLLHGIYSVTEFLIKKKKGRMPEGRVFTFLAVAFAWIFFRAGSLRGALRYIGYMLTAGFRMEQWAFQVTALQLNMIELAVITIAIMIIWLVDWQCYTRKMHLPDIVQQKQNASRYFVFYLLIIAIFVFGVYGPGYHSEQFIYMQF